MIVIDGHLPTRGEIENAAAIFALATVEFERVAYRRRRLKVRLDCGHTIDGGEPYRYQVWKLSDGGLQQRSDCEFCSRTDAAF